MSRKADGTFMCDRCGTDIGNASINDAVTIADLERDSRGRIVLGVMRTLHLCRMNDCDDHVLTKRALRSFIEEKKESPK